MWQLAIILAQQTTPPTPPLKGNCGKSTCTRLFTELRRQYPRFVQKFTAECPKRQILSLAVYPDNPRVYFYCWQTKVVQGTREGTFLGILPYPQQEATFPIAINSDNPQIQTVLDRHRDKVRQIGFECATYGGDINILTPEISPRRLSFQCYFQAGTILIDLNGDWLSDGENSRGAGVDIILGSIFY
jgi:hypothetical protein